MTEDEYADAICEQLKAKNRGYERGQRQYFIIQILTAIVGVYLTIRFLV